MGYTWQDDKQHLSPLDRVASARDRLQVDADWAAFQLMLYDEPDRWSHRQTLAAIVEAWRILDREVTRLAEEE